MGESTKYMGESTKYRAKKKENGDDSYNSIRSKKRRFLAERLLIRSDDAHNYCETWSIRFVKF